MIKRMIFLVLVLLLSILLTTAWAGETKVTGVHKAAFKGDLAKVKIFLKKDVKLINADGENGKKPLL